MEQCYQPPTSLILSYVNFHDNDDNFTIAVQRSLSFHDHDHDYNRQYKPRFECMEQCYHPPTSLILSYVNLHDHDDYYTIAVQRSLSFNHH